MANAAEDSNGYGGGAGGKFRKRPFKRPTTPYDRPVTALRNTSSNISNGGSSGWISRIVDPASKLISASAHKLFSSVFRKRLLPPPPSRDPSPDNNVESPENHLGDEMMDDCSRMQVRAKNEGVAELGQERDKNEWEKLISGPVTDGVAELERILNQKTFTRSEIDHLSVLLQSRTVDKSGIERQRRFELTPYEPPIGHFRQEELDGVVCGNKANPSEVPGTDLTPAVRSKFNDDDIASPAELAKAYMGSRSTAVSPFTLGPRVQAVREENHALTRYQSHSPVVRTVQKPLSTPLTSQNELVIPRSRGRSALYSMARTPYSRVLPTETKGLVTSNGCFTGRSTSTSQKVLKRRCSVLENDIGAVGPIRRIRQKSNLSYTKSLGQSSRTPLTHTTSSEVGEASLFSSSKSQENRGGKSKSVSSLHVSSKSVEMGQRILQQLEKMTPPKDKSSDKKSGISGGILSMESPAFLLGQARKSLETMDSLKCVQNGQVSGKIVDSLDTVLHKAQDSTFQKRDKVHDITGEVFVNSSNKLHYENGDVRIADNDVVGIAKNTAPVVLRSAVGDDAPLNGNLSPLTNEGKRGLEASSVKSNGNLLPENPSFSDATKANRSVFPELKFSSNLYSKKNTAMETSTLAERGIEHSFPTSSVLSKAMESSAPSAQPITTSESDKAGIPASTISFGLSSSDKVSQASFFSSSVAESRSQLLNSASASASGATDVVIKSPGSNTKSIEVVDLLRKPDSTAMATYNTDTAGKLTAFGNSSSSGLPGAASNTTAPSFKNVGFQFGASTTSSTNNQLQSSSHNISSPLMFGDQGLPSKTASASTTESVPSQPAASPFSVSFGSSSLAGSSGVNQSGSSTSVTASFGSSSILGSSSSGFSAIPASGNTNSGSTNVFGGNWQTTSSPVFGSAFNNSSSGPSFEASSMPSSSASSGFALGTSSTSTPANGSKPPVSFGASSTSAAAAAAAGSTSSVFAFGASSSSASSSAPSSIFSFGASSPASTTPASSVFSFGSAASAPASSTPPASQPSFGNGRSMIASGSPGYNQTKMEDTMVEDSMQPSPPSGFIAPASSGVNPVQFSSQQNHLTPAASGANPFQFSSQQNQAPVSSGANPFQFSSQQNQAPASSGANPFQFSSQQNQAPASSGANPFQFSSQQNQAPTPSGANPFQFSSQLNQAPAAAPSGVIPFHFSSQQNQAPPPQNPFQTSDSSGGGSFSLGAGGSDKSNRRIIKVKNRLRKK